MIFFVRFDKMSNKIINSNIIQKYKFRKNEIFKYYKTCFAKKYKRKC